MLQQRLCRMERFKPRQEGKGKSKTGEREMRATGRSKARQMEGVEELEKLSVTATGPLDNPGILSEINLSTRSC